MLHAYNINIVKTYHDQITLKFIWPLNCIVVLKITQLQDIIYIVMVQLGFIKLRKKMFYLQLTIQCAMYT
jgi:energy-converting hydrogenase Eha subunit C